MIKPWLIRIVGKTKQYISLQVLANWIGLLANIVVTASVARLLGALYEGSFEEGQLSATLLAASRRCCCADCLYAGGFEDVLPGFR